MDEVVAGARRDRAEGDVFPGHEGLGDLAQRPVSAHAHDDREALVRVLRGELGGVPLGLREDHLPGDAVTLHHLPHRVHLRGAVPVTRNGIDDENPAISVFHDALSPSCSSMDFTACIIWASSSGTRSAVGDRRSHRDGNRLPRVQHSLPPRLQRERPADEHGEEVGPALPQHGDEPALQRLHPAGVRARALGEDAHGGPAADPLGGLLEGHARAARAARVDGNVAQDLQELAESGDARQVGPPHDGDARERRHDGRDVEHAGMVGHHQVGLPGRAVLRADDARVPAHQPEDQPAPHHGGPTDEALRVGQRGDAAEQHPEGGDDVRQEVDGGRGKEDSQYPLHFSYL